MNWKPIVAGVDASLAGLHAAESGVMLAGLMQTTCTLVHGSRDVWVGAAGGAGLLDVATLTTEVERIARYNVEQWLRGKVPDQAITDLVVRAGPVVRVLDDTVRELGAGLVVLGAKRHSAVASWLGGSTAKNAVRALHTPVLVTTGPARPARILVPVDLSDMAQHTLALAQEWARLFGAKLKVLHVVEPLVMATEGMPLMDIGIFDQEAEQAFERTIWPGVTYPGAERAIRRGSAIGVIHDEIETWKADLVVVGAHGRGRVERVLLGSVSEGVVNSLPCSVLVARA